MKGPTFRSRFCWGGIHWVLLITRLFSLIVCVARIGRYSRNKNGSPSLSAILVLLKRLYLTNRTSQRVAVFGAHLPWLLAAHGRPCDAKVIRASPSYIYLHLVTVRLDPRLPKCLGSLLRGAVLVRAELWLLSAHGIRLSPPKLLVCRGGENLLCAQHWQEQLRLLQRWPQVLGGWRMDLRQSTLILRSPGLSLL